MGLVLVGLVVKHFAVLLQYEEASLERAIPLSTSPAYKARWWLEWSSSSLACGRLTCAEVAHRVCGVLKHPPCLHRNNVRSDMRLGKHLGLCSGRARAAHYRQEGGCSHGAEASHGFTRKSCKYRKSLRICAAEHLSIDRVYGVEHFDGNWNHHAWSMSEATERTVSSGTRPTVSSTPLPSALLATWSEQIATHGGSRPVWLDARLLKSGTLVADSLSCGVPLDEQVKAAGVELWTQRRALDSPMHLHFDCDEERSRLTGCLSCPWRSCVLYMSDYGGPTLLLDFRPSDPWPERVCCYACWPRAGHMLHFPGDWLHGIVSCPPAAGPSERMRQTVVINLWPARPIDLLEISAKEVPLTPSESAICIYGGSEGASHCVQVVNERFAVPSTDLDEDDKESCRWEWTTLTVGTVEGMATVELFVPHWVASGVRRDSNHPGRGESFFVQMDALVRNPPDTDKIGPFYDDTLQSPFNEDVSSSSSESVSG